MVIVVGSAHPTGSAKQLVNVATQPHIKFENVTVRYGAKVSRGIGFNDETVLLIDWKNPANNHFAIAEEVTIGHGVVAHGCTIERRALIGMGSRVLDGAVVGELALVGAGALVPEGMRVPPRTLVVGVPARVKRPLTDEEIANLEQSWKNYVDYKTRYLQA